MAKVLQVISPSSLTILTRECIFAVPTTTTHKDIFAFSIMLHGESIMLTVTIRVWAWAAIFSK
jgi:hypothetical protein